MKKTVYKYYKTTLVAKDELRTRDNFIQKTLWTQWMNAVVSRSSVNHDAISHESQWHFTCTAELKVSIGHVTHKINAILADVALLLAAILNAFTRTPRDLRWIGVCLLRIQIERFVFCILCLILYNKYTCYVSFSKWLNRSKQTQLSWLFKLKIIPHYMSL